MTGLAMLLKEFCTWCSNSFFGHGVRDSVWLFPSIEIIHLVGLGVLGGTVLIINMRLLGIRFRDEAVSDLARELQPWMKGSLIIMLISGFLLFASEAEKLYGNWAFRAKMISLALAILFTFTYYRKVTLSEEDKLTPLGNWTAALVSFVLWTGVGLAGRAIGYV
jgi:hypothetical protein